MNINLRHLFVFHEAARLKGIAAAAKSAHLSQPAVTQAIAGIETFFGTTLFTRRPNGVIVTQSGELCAKRSERALARLRQGILEIGGTAPASLDVGRHVTTSQIDALAAVVAHRSFSAAARARKLSQPSIFRAARELERSLGVTLFEKTSYGIVPTRAAERFARHVRLAFAELEQAHAELAHLQGDSTVGRTVIGAMPLARSYLIPKAVIEFARNQPTHKVSIVEGTYESLLQALRTGEIDFLIGALRDPATLSEVRQEALFDDPLCIVARVGHPLANQRRLNVRHLRRYDWIAPRSGSPLRTHFNELFTASGKAPSASIECNSLAASRALLLESDRLMLLSAHQVHYELKSGTLMTLPHPLGNITRTIGMTYREDWQPTATQAKLLEILRTMARTMINTSL